MPCSANSSEEVEPGPRDCCILVRMLNRRLLSTFALIAPLCVAGCGTGTHPAAGGTQSGSSSFTSGNWQIQSGPYTPSTNATGQIGLMGNLQQGSNGALTGTFRVFVTDQTSGCPLITEAVSFTGTVDSGGAFTLKSAPIAGSILSVDLHPIADTPISAVGTVQITGTGCHVASTQALGVSVKPVNGTFKGTVTQLQGSGLPGGTPTGPSATLTMNLTQAATPSADGQYSVTGSFTVAGSACNYSAGFVGETMGALVVATPTVFSLYGGPANGIDYFFFGIANPTGGGFDFANLILPVSAGCDTLPFSGQLSRQ